MNAAFALAKGPAIQVTSPNPNSGLGQGVFGVDRSNGSGYSQQWNFAVQKSFGNEWNFEFSYLGSKNTRLGIPDANINQLPPQYLSMGAALLTTVNNPYFGQIPASVRNLELPRHHARTSRPCSGSYRYSVMLRSRMRSTDSLMTSNGTRNHSRGLIIVPKRSGISNTTWQTWH